MLEGTVIENVENIKNLGVAITNDLIWNMLDLGSLNPWFLETNFLFGPQDVKEAAYK